MLGGSENNSATLLLKVDQQLVTINFLSSLCNWDPNMAHKRYLHAQAIQPYVDIINIAQDISNTFKQLLQSKRSHILMYTIMSLKNLIKARKRYRKTTVK